MKFLKLNNFSNCFKALKKNKKFKSILLQDILWTYTELIVLMNKA